MWMAEVVWASPDGTTLTDVIEGVSSVQLRKRRAVIYLDSGEMRLYSRVSRIIRRAASNPLE